MRSFLNKILRITNDAKNVIITSGVMWYAKLIKSRFAADAIMMLGGSPIRVEAPPMFDAKISARIIDIGFMFRTLATEMVTGTIRRIMVTLSKNAEPTAVITDNNIMSFQTFPLASFAALIPIY